MITFYEEQTPFDAKILTNISTTLDKSKEGTSQLNKAGQSIAEDIYPLQTDIKKRIQRLQENYSLERRSFL